MSKTKISRAKMSNTRISKVKMSQAAIFDIDKTIVNGNTGMLYVMHFFLKGIISPLYAIKINYYVLRYMLHRLDYESAMRYAYSATRGWPVEKLKKMIKRYHDKRIRHLVYNDMKRIIDEHKKDGRLIIFATNSWEVMVENIAEELKPDYLISTRIGVKCNRFTGEVIQPCFGRHKSELVKNLAAEKKIDMKKSYAYSDHISDLSLLESVGNPVAVNPENRLMAVAKKRGWKVIFPK